MTRARSLAHAIAAGTLALFLTGAARYGVVVGANAAATGRSALKFAHRDATRMADVLRELGGFADPKLLLDPTPELVLATLDKVIAEAAAEPVPPLLLFYYSGHADETALYPAGAPLLMSAVRERIESAKARVRVGIIDACRGGGWTRNKGLAVEGALDLTQSLGLESHGSVLLASSSGIEDAHESDLLQGSFFSHHLVAALRGSADGDQDGEVSLNEAFGYARDLTVRDSTLYSKRPQHPSFDIHLGGRDDVALTRIDRAKTVLTIEQSEGPLELLGVSSGETLLETRPGKRTVNVALPGGSYVLARVFEDGVRSLRVPLVEGQPMRVREADLGSLKQAAIVKKSISRSNARVEASLLGGYTDTVSVLSAPMTTGAHAIAGGVLRFVLTGQWHITERLSLSLASAALSYRFGEADAWQLHVSGGVWSVGLIGTPFLTFGAGADAERRFNARHAVSFGLRTLSIVGASKYVPPDSVPVQVDGETPAPRPLQQTTFANVSAHAGFNYSFTPVSWLTLNLGIVYLQTWDGTRATSPWLTRVSFGGGSMVGLRTLPLIELHATNTLFFDVHAALNVYLYGLRQGGEPDLGVSGLAGMTLLL